MDTYCHRYVNQLAGNTQKRAIIIVQAVTRSRVTQAWYASRTGPGKEQLQVARKVKASSNTLIMALKETRLDSSFVLLQSIMLVVHLVSIIFFW